MLQDFLLDVVIVQVNKAFEGRLQGGGRVETVGAQHVGDMAIETFNHAVGLGPSGRDRAVLSTSV